MIMSRPEPGNPAQPKDLVRGNDGITVPSDANFSFPVGTPVHTRGTMAATTVAVNVRLVYEDNGEDVETVWQAATLANVGTQNATWSADISPPRSPYRYIFVVNFEHSPPGDFTMDRFFLYGTPP
jgi:hypothetical protein